MPEEDSQQGEEDNVLSLASIPSIQDAKIHHDTDDFDPTNTTNSTARETNPSDESINNNSHDGGIGPITGVEQKNTSTTGVCPNEEEAQTTGVQDENATMMAGVSNEDEVFNEDEAPPLQAQIDEREISINICLPEPDAPNTTGNVMDITANIEDQIAAIKTEIDKAYGTCIRDDMRPRR
eukprot:6454759-Ditylum_brightwellii.AAC.3